MFIKIIKKIILTLIALSMLIISLVLWRYQGDTYKLKVERYQSEMRYQDDVYNVAWAMNIGTNMMETNGVEMRAFYLYELPFRIVNYYNQTRHPSELFIYRLVQTDNPKVSPISNTYKLSQAIWISQNLEIEDVMNRNLKNSHYGESYNGINSASKGYFGKDVEQLNIYELLILESLANAPSYFHPKKHPDRLLKRINDSVAQLKKIFPKKYATVESIEELPTLTSPQR